MDYVNAAFRGAALENKAAVIGLCVAADEEEDGEYEKTDDFYTFVPNPD